MATGRQREKETGEHNSLFQRWGQPGQQQGRRIPSFSSEHTRSMCCLRVSGFLTEITQQIHSLRASGVISSHFARATGSEIRAFRKSAGTWCTGPGEIAFLLMNFILHRLMWSAGEGPLHLAKTEVAFKIGGGNRFSQGFV